MEFYSLERLHETIISWHLCRLANNDIFLIPTWLGLTTCTSDACVTRSATFYTSDSYFTWSKESYTSETGVTRPTKVYTSDSDVTWSKECYTSETGVTRTATFHTSNSDFTWSKLCYTSETGVTLPATFYTSVSYVTYPATWYTYNTGVSWPTFSVKLSYACISRDETKNVSKYVRSSMLGYFHPVTSSCLLEGYSVVTQMTIAYLFKKTTISKWQCFHVINTVPC